MPYAPSAYLALRVVLLLGEHLPAGTRSHRYTAKVVRVQVDQRVASTRTVWTLPSGLALASAGDRRGRVRGRGCRVWIGIGVGIGLGVGPSLGIGIGLDPGPYAGC